MKTKEPAKIYKYDFGEMLRQYAELTKPFRRGLIVVSALITVTQALAIVESVMLGQMTRTVLRRSPEIAADLLDLTKMLGAILVTQSLLVLLKNVRTRRTIIGIIDELIDRCLMKIMRLNGPFLESNNSTNLFGRTLKGVNSVENISWQLSNELLPLVLLFIGTMIAVTIIAPYAALVLLPTILLFSALTVWARTKYAQLRKQRHDTIRDANSAFGEIIYNLRTIIANNQQDRLLEHHRNLVAQGTKMLYTEYDFYDRVDLGRSQLISWSRLGVFGAAIVVGWNDPALGGQIVMLSLLTERLLRSCYSIGNAFDRFVDACEPIREMTEILQEEEPIQDPPNPVSLNRIKGEITFAGVSFAYSANASKPALRNVDFTVNAGETVGIVGESGGGKSTIVKLILRFVDPSTGAVRLDGVDLRELKQFDVRRAVGYVPQTVEMFDGTIRDNILFGAPDATDEEMIAAAKLAHAHEFITMFTDGYATRVGDRGLRLSGGQIQRIGLARALLRNPQIILLDEATASVDVRNDVGIHRSIREIAKTGKTVIIIAHRLSTVKDADRLICLDRGQIVETGTPEELRHRANGYYATLLATQEAFDYHTLN